MCALHVLCILYVMSHLLSQARNSTILGTMPDLHEWERSTQVRQEVHRWGRKYTGEAGSTQVGQEVHWWGRKYTGGAGSTQVRQEVHRWGRKYTGGAGST